MINWFQKKCDKIIQRKLESVEEENEILILTDQISLCEELLDKIQDFEQNLQKLIHKGIIINLVSILESFFKLYFNKMIKEWEFSSETLAYTIDKKIKISDLVNFQSRDIHISGLLAEFLNFQDLSDIDKIFRALLELNKSIYELLLDFYNRNLGSKTKKLKSIYVKLQEIIELRHNIVHNIFFELNLTRNEILEYITFIRTIILSLAELISEKLLENNNERGIMTLGFLKWGFYNYKEAIECFKKCIELILNFGDIALV